MSNNKQSQNPRPTGELTGFSMKDIKMSNDKQSQPPRPTGAQFINEGTEKKGGVNPKPATPPPPPPKGQGGSKTGK